MINKADLLDPARVDTLRCSLQRRFPEKEILSTSARSGIGMQPWFDKILNTQASGDAAMELDYEAYAEGAALLGWLNCTVGISARAAWDEHEEHFRPGKPQPTHRMAALDPA